jgi:hypothetical protein
MAEQTCHDFGIGILEAEVKKSVNLKLPAMAEASSECATMEKPPLSWLSQQQHPEASRTFQFKSLSAQRMHNTRVLDVKTLNLAMTMNWKLAAIDEWSF